MTGRSDYDVEGALVACRRADGRWLLIRRSVHVAAPLAICFPGGGVEAGESAAAAAQREMHEELGAVIGGLVPCLDRVEPTRRVRLRGFRAELVGDTLRADPAEVHEILWLTSEEAAAHPEALQPSTRWFLEALLALP